MEFHIGQLIRTQLEAAGMSKSEFARRINTTSQNVYGIFKRKSVDTALLQKISDVLRYDFFQHYGTSSSVAREDPAEAYGGKPFSGKGQSPKELREELNRCHRLVESLRKENEYLKEINALLREKNRKK